MQSIKTLMHDVVNCKLCMKCGTCAGVCPTGAISFINSEMQIDEQKCIQCGRCCKVCPGKEFNLEEWSHKLFKESYEVYNVLGNYQSIWSARTTFDDIYHKAASGGCVTQICLDLIQRKVIDGVVAVHAKKGIPFEFEPFIAETKEEIILSAQSKYILIPVNSIIKEIKQSNKRIAFVGLPCQIQGMRKAMDFDMQLKNQIVVLISLFCGFNMVKEATEYLIKQSGIAPAEISELSYRHKKENQTGFHIKVKCGKEFFVDKHSYTFMNLIYSPERCWMCFDYSGEFADISVGDAWDCKGGGSRVIVRTDVGNKIWESSKALGSLKVQSVDKEVILKTQKMVIRYKKENIGIRKKFSKSFPSYGKELPISTGKARIEGYLLYLIMRFFKTKAGKYLSKHIPFKIMSAASQTIKRKEIS